MTSHPPITLQDLQVLAKNYDQMLPNSYGPFHIALVSYYRSGELQRLAELAEDGERYRAQRDRAWLRYRFAGGMGEQEWKDTYDTICDQDTEDYAAREEAKGKS